MPDLQSLNQENKKERERLTAFVAGLKEADFARRLPNGWTISMAFVHLAFWDFYQITMLKRWLAEGGKPVHGVSESRSVNEPLSILSNAISLQAAAKLVTDAADGIDGMVEKLTPAQAGELLKMRLERTLRRALHRREHLDKIEKTLRG